MQDLVTPDSQLSWQRVANFCAFAFPAMSVGLSSAGYGAGGALLLLAALLACRHWMGLKARDAWPLVAAFLFLSLTWLLDELRTGRGWGALDRPVKFVLILPGLWFLMRFPPRQVWLWAGIGAGAIVAGLRALYDCFVLHMERADGQINAIQFGNLGLLLAAMSGVGLVMWWPSHRTRLAGLLLALGVPMGTLASLLSQTRGGWLALALALPVLLYIGWRWLDRRRFGLAMAALLAGAVIVGALGASRLEKRVDEATQEIKLYEDKGVAESSVGQRLAHWKAAWAMGRERPLLGWSQAGYAAEKARMVNAGEAPAFIEPFTHVHNEFLDVFAKRGLLGVVALVAMYGVTAGVFWPRNRDQAGPEQLGLRVAGLLLPVVYAGCGLTQAFLWHNSGTMFYVFMTALLFASLRGVRLRTEEAGR